MKIKILSDSTCDLPESILKQYDISLTPLSVIKNDEVFKDGITITPAEIFDHVANGGALCTTSAVSVGEYQDHFEAYGKDYDGIIQITIGSGFSACYQNACLAAEEFDNVRIIDSYNITVGQGFLTMKAWELAQNASDLDALAREIQAFASKIETSFVVDKLDFLVKGGRCSSAAALGANLLNLKPCIEVKDNKMTVVKKYRGSYTKCISTYIKDRLDGRDGLDHSAIFVVKTTVPEDCYLAAMDAVSLYGGFQQTLEATAGCTISSHCGPGTLGIVLVRK